MNIIHQARENKRHFDCNQDYQTQNVPRLSDCEDEEIPDLPHSDTESPEDL
jgi:hypothetical protein